MPLKKFFISFKMPQEIWNLSAKFLPIQNLIVNDIK